RPDVLHHRRHVAAHGRRDRGRGHASRRGDHAGGARPVPRRRPHGARPGAGDAPARVVAGRAMTTPPGGEPVGDVPVVSNDDVVRVRQIVRSAADSAGFSLVDQTKIVTAAGELARNTLVHGGGGTAVIERSVNDRRKAGLRIVFTDRGPGIPDVEQALTDGWSTGNGLGLGLSGARRLVDEFTLESAVGEGTTVTVVKWIR